MVYTFECRIGGPLQAACVRLTQALRTNRTCANQRAVLGVNDDENQASRRRVLNDFQ